MTIISQLVNKQLINLEGVGENQKDLLQQLSKTLFDKVWEKHVITGEPGEAQLLYIDLHLIHEVTSPQAFSGLRIAGRKVRRIGRSYQKWFYLYF